MSSREAVLGALRPADKRLRYQHPKAPRSFRRQVLPPLAGILVMLAVLFAVNGQWVVAQIQYNLHLRQAAAATHSSRPAQSGNGQQNMVLPVDDTKSPDPAAGPGLEIPAIGVKAPVISEPGTVEWQIQLALRRGVVRYAGTAEPGRNGNAVLFGHSSGQPWAPGDYKFVFTLLDKLQPGDEIKVDYQGTRYTYLVTGSEVVPPTAISVLRQTTEPTLTLITCTPVGSSTKRLVVHAKLIRPLPSAQTVSTGAAAQSPATAARPSKLAAGQAQSQMSSEAPVALPSSASSSLWSSVWQWLRSLFQFQ